MTLRTRLARWLLDAALACDAEYVEDEIEWRLLMRDEAELYGALIDRAVMLERYGPRSVEN